MRLRTTLRNNTVAVDTANATSDSANNLTPRNGKTKFHSPRASTVINKTNTSANSATKALRRSDAQTLSVHQ